MSVHTHRPAPPQEDPLLTALRDLEHALPLLQEPATQQTLARLLAGEPQGLDMYPALHALVGLYIQHFKPQTAALARRQEEANASLRANDRRAAVLLAGASEAAAAATVAGRNLELVRGMQDDAEALGVRLRRVRAEVQALERRWEEQQQQAQQPPPPQQQEAEALEQAAPAATTEEAASVATTEGRDGGPAADELPTAPAAAKAATQARSASAQGPSD